MGLLRFSSPSSSSALRSSSKSSERLSLQTGISMPYQNYHPTAQMPNRNDKNGLDRSKSKSLLMSASGTHMRFEVVLRKLHHFCRDRQDLPSSVSRTNPPCSKLKSRPHSSISINSYFLTSFGPRHRSSVYIPSLLYSMDSAGKKTNIPSALGIGDPDHELNDSAKEEGATLHTVKDVAVQRSWMRRVIPEKLWPYVQLLRLEKPMAISLCFWPYCWSVCLAARSGTFPDLNLLAWFGLLALIERGAACTVNDFFDRDIDAKIERTRQRPLASGALTPFRGLYFLGIQLLLFFGVLFQFNHLSRMLGALSVPIFCIYPLMKRVTFWPQAFLGILQAWGVLPGWAAVYGNLHLAVLLPLFASVLCWTIVYDTIYAHQDKDDDVKVGVKSTAVLFGDRTKIWLTAFSALCVSGLTLAGSNSGLGWPFYAGVAATAAHLAWQVGSVDLNNPADCSSKFGSNLWLGAIGFSAIFFGKLAAI